MTSELQVKIARAIAEKIAKLKGVAAAGVDDWSDNGSFRVFARLELDIYRMMGKYPHFSTNVNLRSVSASISHILEKAGVWKETIVSPRRHYWRPTGGGRKVFEGYEDDSVQIDFTVPECVTWKDLEGVRA